MLPKEVGTLFNAVGSAEPTAIDAQRLKAELAGIAAFHRELHTNNLLTLEQSDLYQKYIGTYAGHTALTAPPGGVPTVIFMSTPTYGLADIVEAQLSTVECPNCHQKFTLQR
jgi:hypothetical protein